MPSVTLSMTAANAARASAAIQGLWPIPQIPDPEWLGDPEDAPRIDEYSAMEWAKIKLRSFLPQTVQRWENKVAKEAAEVPEDLDIAT